MAVPLAARGKHAGARPDFALIFGTVFGPDDHPIYGVPVKLRRVDAKKKPASLVSDHNGEFALRVPAEPADYVAWLDVKDKQAAKASEVTVHVTKDEREDVTLHLREIPKGAKKRSK